MGVLNALVAGAVKTLTDAATKNKDKEKTTTTAAANKATTTTTATSAPKVATAYSTKQPDMSRREDLAGKTVSSNGMNVTYDENGYATSATNYKATNQQRAQSKDVYDGDQALRQTAKEQYGLSDYDIQNMSDRQIQGLIDTRQLINSGVVPQDEGHGIYEGVRAQYGYSGGDDGSQYIKLGSGYNDPVATYINLMSNQSGIEQVQPSKEDEIPGYAEWFTPTNSAGGAATSGAAANAGVVPSASAGSVYASSGATGYGGTGYNTNDLTEYIRQQNAAQLEANLAALKESYDKSMNGYQQQISLIPQSYDAARNATAAQDALARRQFDERAIAAGLSSGANAQMELSRSAALQSALSDLDQQQQNAVNSVNTNMANIEASYQSAIAQAKANGNAALAEALYNELVRVENQQRQDAQLARQYQTTLAQLGAQYGDYSGLNALGINTTAYEQERAAAKALEEANRKAAEEAALAEANAYKPTFTAAQVKSAYDNYVNGKGPALEGNMQRDFYYYYYGDPDYGSATGASAMPGSTAEQVQAAFTGGGGGNPTPSVSYNNGGLTTGEVLAIQQEWNRQHPDRPIAEDGYWGPNSQSVTGASDAATARTRLASGTPTQTTNADYFTNPLSPGANGSPVAYKNESAGTESTFQNPLALGGPNPNYGGYANERAVQDVQNGYNALSANGKSLYTQITNNVGLTTANKQALLLSALNSGSIKQSEYDFLTALL